MNYLLIILAVIFFFKNFNGNNNGVLGGLSYNDISPLLNLIKECGLLNDFPLSNVENLLSGNFNFSELLPLILSFFNGFKQENYTENTDNLVDVGGNFNSGNEGGLNPINDIFNSEFCSAVENYFKN